MLRYILYYIRYIITIPSNHSWTCRPSRKDKSTTFGLVKVFEGTSPCRSGKCVSICHWWLGRLTKSFWKIWESPRSSKHPKLGGGLTPSPFLFLPLWRNERSKKDWEEQKTSNGFKFVGSTHQVIFKNGNPGFPGLQSSRLESLQFPQTKHPPGLWGKLPKPVWDQGMVWVGLKAWVIGLSEEEAASWGVDGVGFLGGHFLLVAW